MRTAELLLTLLLTTPASAQLVNGSFEDGLNGWQVHNYGGEDSVSLTNEVPPGGGVQSMAMHINGYDLGFENIVVQPVGNLPPGTVVQFGGWIRATADGAVVQLSPSITLCACDSAGFALPVGPDLFYPGPQPYWTFQQATLTINSLPPPGTVHCLKLGGGVVYQNMSFLAWFDDLFFLVDPSTGTADMTSTNTPRFRPNPATDKLWVDLSEVPLSITTIDASGRIHALKNFTHRDHTFEVDVSSLPGGISFLRITTVAGTRVLRFVKA